MHGRKLVTNLLLITGRVTTHVWHWDNGSSLLVTLLLQLSMAADETPQRFLLLLVQRCSRRLRNLRP